MKHIKILGTGCAKCKKVEAIVKEVITKHKLDATVEKVEDLTQIMSYNIMSTPAVVVDEQVKIYGKVPTEKEVLSALN